MPETKVASKGRGKGKGLTKKVGPLPVYAYLIGVVVIVGYIIYRHRSSGSSSATGQFNGSLDQQTIPSGVVVPSSNGSSSGDSGSASTTPVDWSGFVSALQDSGALNSNPVQYPTDYATQTDLANAVDNVNNETAKTVAAITFPTPNINITVPTTGKSSPAAKTTATKTAAKKSVPAPKKITYYTYKKNVPLRAGQTLHYAKNKGYYAA